MEKSSLGKLVNIKFKMYQKNDKANIKKENTSIFLT